MDALVDGWDGCLGGFVDGLKEWFMNGRMDEMLHAERNIESDSVRVREGDGRMD